MAVLTAAGQRQRLNLALQGGGAHGAFTWGVLDQLLEADRFDFGAISGTSAGAVNAAALVSGWAKGGAAGARETLTAVWTDVYEGGSPSPAWFNPFFANIAEFGAAMATYAGPQGANPLRPVLEANIDAAAVRDGDGLPELLIAATEVATGLPKLFRRKEFSIDVVLASACLPALMRAVEIGGVAYWDGGYSANPDLVTLAGGGTAGDTLLVTVDVVGTGEVPDTAREVAQRINSLTFAQPLLRDIAHIAAVREAMAALPLLATRRTRRLATQRFHLIDGGPHTAKLSATSRVLPDRDTILGLRDAGREEASRWLSRNGSDVGRRNSADLAKAFLMG
jgi:NTE family protein